MENNYKTRKEAAELNPGPLDEARMESGLRLYVEEDPYSVVRMVPDSIRRAMLALPDDLRGQEEGNLRPRVRPKPVHNQIRLCFWLEYERCKAALKPKMVLANIYGGIMAEETFYATWLTDPLKVAWMVCPPISYTIKLEEMLHHGYDRIKEILDAPMINPKTGLFDPTVAKLIMQATMMIDMRVKGAIVQKLEHTSKNISLSVNMRTGQQRVNEEAQNLTMEMLDKRLAELQRLEEKEKARAIHIEAISGTAEDMVVPEPVIVDKKDIKPFDNNGQKYELCVVDGDEIVDAEFRNV